MSINILGISGSLRRDSLNRALLRAAASVLPKGVTLTDGDISGLPLYNWDVEQESGFPDAVVRFRDQMAMADGLLISTPEYNNSMPGALKNAIDWASRGGANSPLNHLPTAIMGAAGRLGSIRAQMHLRTVFLHSDLKVVQKPEVLVPGGDSFRDGELVNERYLDQIRRLTAGLVELIAD